MMTSKERAALRAQANPLEVTLIVGKSGISQTLLDEAVILLDSHELVKGRVLENSLLTAREACDELSALTRSEQVQVIGTKFVLYRPSHKKDKKDKIVLATVKGDIHDIGKNIVKVLLENYSYDVLDLGKDVAPEAIVEETIKNHVRLVGLSALMTTTVPSMEETIKQLRKEAPWAKVMVGGAVLTQEYADMIGADAYCRDAMASVNYAQQVLV